MNLIPCMGGACQSRDFCANYLSESVGTPVERLCGPDKEEPETIRVYPERLNLNENTHRGTSGLRPEAFERKISETVYSTLD